MISPGRSWREFPQRYRLEAEKCTVCGKIHYPPRVTCSKCGARTFETLVLPREGRVVTFTVVRVPPAGFTEQTPLPIALIELDDGVQVMAQIGDVEDPTGGVRNVVPERGNYLGKVSALDIPSISKA